MTKREAIKHFGTAYRLAKSLNITQAAVSRWGKYVPLVRAVQIERISGGALKVDLAAYDKRAA